MDTKIRLLLFLPLLAVGLVSFVIVRSQQGEGATLAARQRSAQALTPASLARVVRVAPESSNGPGGKEATCTPLGSGELHNPWKCVIRYRDGHLIQYRITVAASGSYTGDDQVARVNGRTTSGPGTIQGCCVVVP